MNIKELEVKSSLIQGQGLFTKEYIKKGEIVMLWNINAYITSEKEYNRRQKLGDKQMIDTGVRYVNDHFLYTDHVFRYENYINHSFSPNILYHCGICFAMKDIYPGDELTTDYTYLLSEHDDLAFYDYKTEKYVKGVDAYTCLLHTTIQLKKILEND